MSLSIICVLYAIKNINLQIGYWSMIVVPLTCTHLPPLNYLAPFVRLNNISYTWNETDKINKKLLFGIYFVVYSVLYDIKQQCIRDMWWNRINKRQAGEFRAETYFLVNSWYLDFSLSRLFFKSPYELEITRVDCIFKILLDSKGCFSICL